MLSHRDFLPFFDFVAGFASAAGASSPQPAKAGLALSEDVKKIRQQFRYGARAGVVDRDRGHQGAATLLEEVVTHPRFPLVDEQLTSAMASALRRLTFKGLDGH